MKLTDPSRVKRYNFETYEDYMARVQASTQQEEQERHVFLSHATKEAEITL